MVARIRSKGSFTFIVGVLVLVSGPVSALADGDSQSENPRTSSNWAQYLHDASHTSFNEDETFLTEDSARSLELSWTKSVDPAISTSPALADAGMYVTSDSSLMGLDPSSGATVWEQDKEAVWWWPAGSPSVSDDVIHFYCHVGRICASSPTGELLWDEVVAAHGPKAGLAVQNDLVIGASQYRLFALDASNGDEVWSVELNLTGSDPAVADGRAYIVDNSDDGQGGALICLDATSGQRLWTRPVEGGPFTAPVVSEGEVFVGGDAKMSSFDALTGAKHWAIKPPSLDSFENLSIPAVDHAAVYAGSNLSGTLFALDRTNGAVLWKKGTRYHHVSTPAVTNDVVYVASSTIGDEDASTLEAYSAATGALLTRKALDVDVSYRSSPIVADGHVYLIADELLYAFTSTDSDPGGADTTLQWVALGDSYSSGEGNPPFNEGTAVSQNHCHRSRRHAYPQIVHSRGWADDLLFRACSGARTGHFYNAQNATQRRQLSYLSDDTDVVTLTIGGNDMEFANILKRCGHRENCHEHFEADFEYWLARLEVRLNELFPDIRSAVTAETHVFILSYPQIFPVKRNQECPWHLRGYRQEEIDWMRSGTTRVNNVVEDVATAAGFHFVDVEAAFDDHLLCSSNPYTHAVDANDWEFSFHPNKDGQRAMANILDARFGDVITNS